MKFLFVVFLFFGFNLLGCSHAAMRGSVAMKISDQEAHVCLGEKEVAAGDKVDLFKNICEPKRGGAYGGAISVCKKVKIGSGEVVKILNEHYSLVRVAQGVQFEEGTIVEKQ